MSTRARLNGWKEIAAHFGKGVRTVQRWEQVYDLPVRRVSGDGGEIIYAFVEELDDWEQQRRSSRHGHPSNGSDADAGPADLFAPPGDIAAEADVTSVSSGRPATDAGHRAGARAGVRLALLAAVAALVWALVAWAWSPRPAAPAPPLSGPARVTVQGDRVRAYDAEETFLWEHVLDSTVNENPPLVILVDLDHDGASEVVVRVTGKRLDSRPFLVLGHDGQQRLLRSPSDTVHFGETPFTPPWLAHTPYVTEGPDRASTLWLAFTHGKWFPQLVEAYDGNARLIATYWSNGYVGLIAEGRLAGADTVFIGATNNEFRGASLALFDAGKVAGSAPAEQAKYRCTDCPPGRPREFIVFPRSCIDSALDEQPNISQVLPYGDGRLSVTVETGNRLAGTLYYEFGPDLALLRIEVGKEFRSAHLLLERAGQLDHAYASEDFSTLQPVRRWVGGRFEQLAIVAVEKR